MWWLTLWNEGSDLLRHGVLLAAAAYAMSTDLRRRRIPNALTGPLLLAGLGWAAWAGGPAGLVDSVAACFVLALPYVLLFVLRKGGAGDAKMMGALGAWLGLANGLIVLVLVTMLAAGYAAAIMVTAARRRSATLQADAVVETGPSRDCPSAVVGSGPPNLVLPMGGVLFIAVCIWTMGLAIWSL